MPTGSRSAKERYDVIEKRSRTAKQGGAWDEYRRAGVDIEAGERAVELMREAVQATRPHEDFGGLGGFASAIAMPKVKDPLIVSSADGVGTKTEIVRLVGRYKKIGRDLVAMCADDLVCAGAEPLFFLDYLVVGRMLPERVAEIVGSIADGCVEAGCALVGGETAEHPGLMEPDQFDLAGFCVGVVARHRLLDGTAAQPGDALVGIASSGLHSNGYSLVRRLVRGAGISYDEPYAELLARKAEETGTPIEPEASTRDQSLGEVLLIPTAIYAKSILNLRKSLDAEESELRGVAHITGGGLPGNIPRVLPDGLGARVDPSVWRIPSVMRLMAVLGKLADIEIRSVFNGGLGMVVVVPPSAVGRTIASLEQDGLHAWHIGEVVPVEELGGVRYREGH
jgi:phosphoribosylformylglycinamidine cyclo-ligase